MNLIEHVDRVEYLGSDRLVYGTMPKISPDARVIARLPFTVTAPVEEQATAQFAVAESSGERIQRSRSRG